MKRKMKICLVVMTMVLMATALPAAAGRGGKDGKATGGNGGGKLTATLEVSSDSGASADGNMAMVFDVTRSIVDNSETMWVTNTCHDADGNVVSDVDHGVIWGTWDSLEGTAGVFETAGTSCTAYVTMRPWQNRPMSGTVIDYTP